MITTKSDKYIIYYHLLIGEYAQKFLTNELLVEKIRQAPNDAEGLTVLKKFRSFLSGNTIFFFPNEAKVKEIKHNQEILRFFGITYPSPPEEIAHLFCLEKPGQEISSELSPKQLMINLNVRIAKNAEQNPVLYTANCTSCGKRYVYKSVAELLTCPHCGKSDEDDL